MPRRRADPSAEERQCLGKRHMWALWALAITAALQVSSRHFKRIGIYVLITVTLTSPELRVAFDTTFIAVARPKSVSGNDKTTSDAERVAYLNHLPSSFLHSCTA